MAPKYGELQMDEDSYLALDRRSELKHQLWDGEVHAVSGASLAHNLIVVHLLRHLGNALDGSPCEPLPSDMRVRLSRSRYVYPDVTAYRTIAGLDEVVFVSQHERRVETYTRQADESWLMRESLVDGSIALRSLPVPMSLNLVYDGVELEA
jgi:Uma2 family endonuclease